MVEKGILPFEELENKSRSNRIFKKNQQFCTALVIRVSIAAFQKITILQPLWVYDLDKDPHWVKIVEEQDNSTMIPSHMPLLIYRGRSISLAQRSSRRHLTE